MATPEIVGLTVAICSAFYIPIFMRALRLERRVIEAQAQQLSGERKQFFEATQEKAAANAHAGCRLCSVCRRVVHRFDVVKGSVICHECKLK